MIQQDKQARYAKARSRAKRNQVIAKMGLWAAAMLTLGMLILIVGYILVKGVPGLSWEFLSQSPKGMGNEGGIFP